jgi:hypothetical protein
VNTPISPKIAITPMSRSRPSLDIEIAEDPLAVEAGALG